MWVYNSSKNCKENLLDCKAAFPESDPKTIALIFSSSYNSYKKALKDLEEASKFFNNTAIGLEVLNGKRHNAKNGEIRRGC